MFIGPLIRGLSQLAAPIGGALGGLFGGEEGRRKGQQIGGTIGDIGGTIGGFLPFAHGGYAHGGHYANGGVMQPTGIPQPFVPNPAFQAMQPNTMMPQPQQNFAYGGYAHGGMPHYAMGGLQPVVSALPQLIPPQIPVNMPMATGGGVSLNDLIDVMHANAKRGPVI